jgi:hypothetical protein
MMGSEQLFGLCGEPCHAKRPIEQVERAGGVAAGQGRR